MVRKALVVAFGMVVATSPVSATNPNQTPATAAPAASPGAKYCMHVESVTGTRIETIRCWTRQQWADLGVDVDQDWSTEGVAVIT